MTTTIPGTHTPVAREDGPPTPEQLVAALVAWLSDMPAVRRALIASALGNNRWKPNLAVVFRQAVDQLLAAAREQAVPHPYEHVAKQLGVADADVDAQPITGDPVDHMLRLARKLSQDTAANPAVQEVQEVREAADPAPRTSAPHEPRV